MDLEFITAAGALGHQNCVVEIAGGFAVDGDDGQAAEVAAAVGFRLVEMGDAARLCQHIVWKDARQLVLADHHLDVDAEVIGIAENLDDAAHGRTRGRGPTGDFDIDHQALKILARLGRSRFSAQNPVGRGELVDGGSSWPSGTRMC